ncbi:hypothetical protein [Azospirillum sp. sgz302134]
MAREHISPLDTVWDNCLDLLPYVLMLFVLLALLSPHYRWAVWYSIRAVWTGKWLTEGEVSRMQRTHPIGMPGKTRSIED